MAGHSFFDEHVPRAYFKVKFPPGTNSGDEVSRMIENHLRAKFGSLRRETKLWWWFPQTVELKVGQKALSVVWYRRKFTNDGWILFVVPSEIPIWWYRLRGRDPKAYIQELMLVSREIHAFLALEVVVTGIWWYFKVFRRQGKDAVATPDELPWSH